MILKKCNKCGLEAYDEEDIKLFRKNKECTYGVENTCKECYNAYLREYNKKNPLMVKESRVKSLYNITLEEYESCMSMSDCCQICGTKEKLVYDHCHDSMQFRGVLCSQCNSALGLLGDTKEGLEKALKYLEYGEKI